MDSSAPAVEVSYSLDGTPARIRGMLMRARDGGFEPTLAGPGPDPANAELIHVLNQAPQPFPPFTDADGNAVDAETANAVQRFLGGADITGLCSSAAPECDFRTLYYESYRTPWASVQNDLTEARSKCAQGGEGFTASACEGIRAQLQSEVSKVAKVAKYFGPEGLQQPFGAAGVSALADLKEIEDKIQAQLQAPGASDTTSNALLVAFHVIKVGQSAFGLTDKANQVATGLASVLGAVGYYTRPNGEPNLVGPKVTTTASRLGVELAGRLSQAGDNFDDVGRMVVSDYGKLTTVAAKVNAKPGPGEVDWRLGNVASARRVLEVASEQTIYERLVPVAFPIMYDLGSLGNARDWYCDGGLFGANQRLFGDQPDGDQFIGRFPSTGVRPLIAVGAERATGTGGGARIRSIPGAIVQRLLTPAGRDGIGVNKLELFSPRNGFRYQPAEPKEFGTRGRDGRFDTLHMYPRQEARSYLIPCGALPNPPGDAR
jgi:hypothetical protein